MCEQLLINYCSHRNEQPTNGTNTPYLSSMNLLVVTLCYLKHYHSKRYAERYIATDLNLRQLTVNYILSAIVNILHDCIYSELISLSVNITNRSTAH